MLINLIKKHISAKCGNLEVKIASNKKFGDFTVECFSKSKDFSQKLANKIKPDNIIQEINAIGPYLNFKITHS